MKLTPLVIAATALAGTAAPAAAQAVRGRVVDHATELPVPDAVVALLAEGGVEAAQARTDGAGAFEVRVDGAGAYALRVTRLGYAGYTSEAIEFSSGETVVVELRIGVAAIPLEPLVVTARRSPRRGRFAEFEQRRTDPARASGRFVTREDIDRRPLARPSEHLVGIASVTVRPVITTGSPFGPDRNLIFLPGTRSSGGCIAHLYIDGVHVPQSTDFTIDDYLDSSVLGGIEVYPRPAFVPPQYQRDDLCGAVLFWTREPEGGNDWSWKRIAAGAAGFLLIGVLVVM